MSGTIEGLAERDKLIFYQTMRQSPGQTGGPVFYKNSKGVDYIVGINLGGNVEN